MPTAADIPLHVFEVLEEEYISLHGPLPADEVSLVELPDEGGLDSAEAQHTRVVEAARDWRFRRGHVKDPVGLAADLLLDEGGVGPRGVASLRSVSGSRDDLMRAELRNYVTAESRISRATLVALAEWRPARGAPPAPPRELVIPLEEALNGLLRDADLYHADRFSKNWLGLSTRGLVKLRDAGHTFAGPDEPAPAPANAESDAPTRAQDDAEAQPAAEAQADAAAASAEAASAEAAAAEARAYRTPRAHFHRLLLEDAFPDYIERMLDIRLAAIYQKLHAAEPVALSLSGGGIRSGTFALGLIQGLARHDLLKRFDYLSTVSGGGYIGGWLTAWLHRHPEGVRGVTHDLKNSDPVSKIDPDPKPLQYLRTYSNFITPRAGFLTADTWTFVGIYFRNLLLNWMVFIPLLLGVLMLPRLVLTATLWQPVDDALPLAEWVSEHEIGAEELKKLEKVPEEKRIVYPPQLVAKDLLDLPAVKWSSGLVEDNSLRYRLLLMPGVAQGVRALSHLYYRHFLLLPGVLFGVWALGYIGFNRPSERGALVQHSPFWRDRTDQRHFLLYCLLPLVISAACLTTYWAWSQEGATASKNLFVFLLYGLGFTIGGALIASHVLGRFSRKKKEDVRGKLAILFAGLLSGGVFWVVSLFELGANPVVGYGVGVRDRAVVRPPFAWTDWASWSWSDWTTETYVCLAVPLFLLIFWGATTFFVGMSSYDKNIDDDDREWWARFGAWLLIAALAWAALNAVVIFAPLALLESPKLLGAVGGLSGLVAVLVGRSSLTPARGKAAADKEKTKAAAAAGLLGRSLTLLGLIFLCAFLALLSLTTTGVTRKIAMLFDEFFVAGQTDGRRVVGERLVEGLTNVEDDGPNKGFDDYVRYITPVVPAPARPTPTPPAAAAAAAADAADAEAAKPAEADAYTGAKIVHLNVLHHTSLRFTVFLSVCFLLLGGLLSRWINLNVFSVHGGYRDRLIRGFLGASRPAGERHPNPFTGFDPADNIQMHELRWALFDEADLLDPSKLADKLLKGRPPDVPGRGVDLPVGQRETHPLSEYLWRAGLLAELDRLSTTETSPSLTKALRTDLNRVLEEEKLYVLFEADYLNSRRADLIRGEILNALRETTGGPRADVPLDKVPLRDVPLRSDYSILLNRLVLEEAYPDMFRPGVPPPYKMMHVVSTSLNLVGGDNLAWQQRKAEPFSVSPLHSGCFRIGYRPSRDYGGPAGISLGTAAAISGAAASPNMGYYTTSPLISLLLTLFNVRLGWWLGNPGPAGQDTYRLRAPLNSVTPVISEALGRTDDRNPHVYLTDGGHFENLGLYEMVLRRCHVIVCSDGAQDEEYRFGDLGNAVRKIRIDLGISIDFPCVEIYDPSAGDEKRKGRKGMYWAVGRIRYSDIDLVKPQGRTGAGGEAGRPAAPAPDGLLLYIKPAVYGDEPRDVLEYKKTFPAFPHQSTGDQFFDEPQFESYRGLGSYIMDQLCGESFEPLPLGQVLANARASVLEKCREKELELDDNFLTWLWGLTGEAPPAARPKPAAPAAESQTPQRPARRGTRPPAAEGDAPAPARGAQTGEGERPAEARAERARPPEEENE